MIIFSYTNQKYIRGKKYIRGFTLVELSIVIVIIGLIVAGVTAGQSLVRQAQLNKVITEVSSYRVAFNSFILQYGNPPGDLINAQSFWPASANGDGNGKVNNTWATNEHLYTWNQLGLSGLIPANYAGNGWVVGVNMAPAAIGGNSGYIIQHEGWYYASPRYNLANRITIGGSINSCCGYAMNGGANLIAKEAAAIDTKMDDGIPSGGKVFAAAAGSAASTGCTSSGVATASATYLLTENVKYSCRLSFTLQ